MSSPNPFPVSFTPPSWLREAMLGFSYWLVFLLVLEPDNLLRASRAGEAVNLGEEALRIGVAALMGASVTPVVVQLLRRFPIDVQDLYRRTAIHVAAALGLGFGLVLISCFLAAWVLQGQSLPTVDYVAAQLIANGFLVSFALLAFSGVAQIALKLHRPDTAKPEAQSGLTYIDVVTRGRAMRVKCGDIDWIESQGNYLALHVGADVHLIRSRLHALVAQIDAQRFVRIHRRLIVATDRIAAIQALSNGDAEAHLNDGQVLRVSRLYRKALMAAWRARDI